MPADEGHVDAPAEMGLTPFRWCAAALCAAQTRTLAFARLAAEVTEGAFSLYGRQAQLGLAWAEALSAAMAKRTDTTISAPTATAPNGGPGAGGQGSSQTENHAQEVAMRVKECMTREVQIAYPTDTIGEAAKIMARLDAGVLPVGENDRLVGMITDRDIAVRGVAQGKGPDAKVADVMNAEVKYCFDDQEIGEVLRNMGELQLRRMPVLNHEKRLVGIISLGDVACNGQAQLAGDALGDISRQGGLHSQTAH